MIEIDALNSCEITALIKQIGYDNLVKYCDKEEFISRLSNDTLLNIVVNDTNRDIENITAKYTVNLSPKYGRVYRRRR
jgi:translation initiation factor 2 alpha subunit (eIF-2alpha)